MSHQYFIIKSSREWGNDLPHTLKPGSRRTWVTGQNNFGEFEIGDRLFMWEGSPDNYVIGTATILNPFVGYDVDGKRKYEIEYLDGPYDSIITKDLLLDDPSTAGASFLKKGNASGVVPLRDVEADAIEQMLSVYGCSDNPFPDDTNMNTKDMNSKISPELIKSAVDEYMEDIELEIPDEDILHAVSDRLDQLVKKEVRKLIRPHIESMLAEIDQSERSEKDD